MRIGIFTDAYDPQINGVVISTKILKKELEALGHHVTIITVSDPKVTDSEENILRLPSVPFAVLPNFRVGSIYSYKIMKSIKDLNLDIINTQTEFSLGVFARIVAKKMGIPIVHTYHTMYEDYSHYFSVKAVDKYAKKLARKFSKLVCNTVQNVVVPTKKVELVLQEYGLNKSINVIPTGVDVKPFDERRFTFEDKLRLRNTLGLKDEPVLLFVGRLAKEKSIDLVLKQLPETLKRVPNLKFLIVGDGPEMNRLKALSIEQGVEESVIFTGKVPWDQIGIYYGISDIFISASTTETQGLTYIEAMAAKKVVLARYDTNLDETIVDGVNGRFFTEAEEIPGLIEQHVKDELLSYYLSRNAYSSVQDLSSEHFGKAIESIYYDTLISHSSIILGTS
jgi:1,2-diacylglycerol 3-alpha-glucosyltransferase